MKTAPTYKVTANRPRQGGVIYQVTGPDFLLLLREGEPGRPGSPFIEDNMPVEYAASVTRNVKIGETGAHVAIICHAASAVRCEQEIGKIEFSQPE